MPIMHTQSLDDFRGPRSDDRMPRSHLRHALYRLGYKGAELRKELERITAGPLAPVIESKDVDAVAAYFTSQSSPTYPYGWPKSELTRPMRRIFHGMEKNKHRHVVVDEYWKLVQ